MSKKVKKLLEESTIRKFMKYANIEPLAENFLDTVQEDDDFGEEEEVDVDMAGEEPEMDMAGEPGMDMEPEPEVDEELVQRIVAAVADAIEQETGVAVDVEGGAEPEMDMAPEPEGELGPEMDMAPEPEEEPVEMAEAEEEEVEEGYSKKYNREDDDLEESESEEFDYESVVSEVARRVALRLVKESKKQITKAPKMLKGAQPPFLIQGRYENKYKGFKTIN